MSRIHHYQWYYKTDLQTVSLGEMMHFVPGWRGFWLWVCKTFGFTRLPVIPGSAPLPFRAASFLQPPEKLSDQARTFIEPIAENLERLDFERIGYESNDGFLSDEIPDGGGCHFLHRNGRWVASVIYFHTRIEEMGETIQLNIWGVRSDGSPFRVLNLPPWQVVDPFSNRILNSLVYWLDTTSPTELFQFFEKKVAKGPGINGFRQFSGPDDVLRCMEENSVRVLEAKLREGRYIPMTEAEVAELRRKHGKK
jgi:hypothetical protein